MKLINLTLLIQVWENEIRKALMPVTPQASATPAHPQQVGMDKEEATCNDISQIYQIFPDEVLGSGQFGIVYGGKYKQLLSNWGRKKT